MNTSANTIPTLEECLTLWNQKQTLTADIEHLKTERVGLQASVDYLRHAEHKMRVSIAQLCYDMSNILDIAGKLADTGTTDTWHNLPKP